MVDQTRFDTQLDFEDSIVQPVAVRDPVAVLHFEREAFQAVPGLQVAFEVD